MSEREFCQQTKTKEMINDCIENYKDNNDDRCAVCVYYSEGSICLNLQSCMYMHKVKADDACCYGSEM